MFFYKLNPNTNSHY
ncbi:hypothetical protein N499_0030A, partial [Wolbachia pipientis wVitA]